MTMNLQWPGFTEKGSVIIALPRETFCFPDKILVLDDVIYQAKDELHITLIGSDPGSLILGRVKQDQALQNRLMQIFEAIDWSFKQTGPVHILSRVKDGMTQGSIILLLAMGGIREFYNQLGTAGIIERQIPAPPPHITLYTHNCPAGIGVPDIVLLNKLTVAVYSSDELESLVNRHPDN
jgi:hypothetical protein